MSFRISQQATEGGRVIRVSGDLTGQAVETLREQLATATEPPPTAVSLDLSELRFVQTTGARLLAKAEKAGVELRAASPYVELLIERNREVASGSDSGAATGDKSRGNPKRTEPSGAGPRRETFES